MRGNHLVAAGVFVGVLAGTALLAFVLLHAGRASVEEVAPPGRGKPARTPEPPREKLSKPELAEPLPLPPLLEPRRVSAQKPRFAFEGHDDLHLRDWGAIGREFVAFSADLHAGADGPWPLPEDQMLATMEKARRFFETANAIATDRPPKSVTPMDHPAVMVNVLAAALDAFKLPLTDAQAERISGFGKARFPVLDAVNLTVLPEDPTVYRLDLVLRRFETLDRFWAEVFAVLTPAQAEAVSPERHRGRARTDMFSGVAALLPSVLRVDLPDESAVVDHIVVGLAPQLGLVERPEELRAIVETWMREVRHEPPDTLEHRGFIRVSRMLESVRRMADLLRRLTQEMKLEGSSLQAARDTQGAYMPMISSRR